jgi:hypothetical protein
MDSPDAPSCVAEIGVVAGLVWHALEGNEPVSISKLIKTIDAPRDIVLQAVGWLAREDKIWIEATKRGRLISLR